MACRQCSRADTLAVHLAPSPMPDSVSEERLRSSAPIHWMGRPFSASMQWTVRKGGSEGGAYDGVMETNRMKGNEPLSGLSTEQVYGALAGTPVRGGCLAGGHTVADSPSPAQLLAFAPGKEQAAGVWEP